MNTVKLKTDIKCSGCIEKVTPHLNENEKIEKWEVDLQDPNKILTVEGRDVSQQELISVLDKAGFTGEPA